MIAAGYGTVQFERMLGKQFLGSRNLHRPKIILVAETARLGSRIYETCREKKRRRYVTGKEVTATYRRGAEAALAIAKKYGCRLAILCRWSPSCSRTGVAGKLLAKHGVKIIETF